MINKLVLSIVAFICVQTIDATSSNVFSCTNQLSKLRTDAAIFFTEFQNEHNIAHEDLTAIQSAVSRLGASLNLFVDINYGDDFTLDVVQCNVKHFLDLLSVQHVEADKRIAHFEHEVDMLLNMVNNFAFRHNLICARSASSGCETDLNDLRCELSGFFEALRGDARKASADLRGIERESRSLSNLERRFKSKYRLVCDSDTDPQPNPHQCGCSKPSTTTLRSDLKYYHGEATQLYVAGSNLLNDITGICYNLSSAIEYFVSQFN